MERGYVKMWRKIEDSGLLGYGMKESGFLSFMLLKVNWKSGKWRGEIIHPGSTITSISSLSSEIHESEKVTRRLIKLFEDLGILTREVKANRWTKLTLCNWASYQDLPCVGGILKANKGSKRGKGKGKGRGKAQGKTIKEGNNKEGNNISNPFTNWTREEFWVKILEASKDKDYSEKALSDFFFYWNECDTKGKMRLQLQDTWDTAGRLRQWNSNKFN